MLFKIKPLAKRLLLPSFKKFPLLALDLGWGELRFLALQKREHGFHIERIGHVPLPLELFEGRTGLSWEPFQAAVSAWLKQSDWSGYALALAMTGQLVIKKQIELPRHMTEAECAHELRFRLYQYFPGIPEQALYFDYLPGPSHEDKQSLILFAAKKESLQIPIELFGQFGIQTKMVEADLYALARAALPSFSAAAGSPLAVLGLLNLRWPFCSFLVFHQDDILFHHQWYLDREAKEMMFTSSSSLLQQVKSVWQLYRSSYSPRDLDALGLAGEGEGLESLTDLLEQVFSLRVNLINPFQNMTYAPDLDMKMIEQGASRFLLSCGLAMRGPHI